MSTIRHGRKPSAAATALAYEGRVHPGFLPPAKHLLAVSSESYIKSATPAERSKRLKRIRDARIKRARESFGAFVEYVFWDEHTGRPIQQQWFHDEWSRAMDTANRLIIVAPRDHGKTTQIVARVIWELGRDPNLRIKIVCASDGKAIERLFEVIQHLSNPRVREVFPNLVPAEQGEWSKHKIVVERTARHRDASVEALGITSTATGGRADLLIADDVVDRRNALTMPALREQIKHAWKSDWTNLLEPHGRVWYICTLWHKADLSHELLANPSYTKIFHAIPDDFGAMWPGKWNEASLRARHQEIGSQEFNRAFRNIASDVEEGIVKPDWFRFVDLSREPAFSDEKISDLIFFTSYDTAVAVTDLADFSSGVDIAVDTSTGFVYVIDAWHARVTIKTQADRVWSEFLQFQPFRILIEKAGQSTLDEWVLNDHPDLVGIVEVTKPRVSKSARLLGVTPLMEAGRVFFSHHLDPNRPSYDPSRGSLVHELQDFPFGKNDDMVDAFSQALSGARRYFLDAWATGGDNELDIRISGDDEEDDRYDF
jgi:phage terminase large subunit-like protein